MSEISDRYRKVAARFTETARSVPDGGWDQPTPCEGWVARDVIGHLVEWVPRFFSSYADLNLPEPGSVDDDPVGSWLALDSALQATLDDPAVAGRTFEMRGNRYSVEEAIATFCLGDVLVHTWDLARATGLDETLDSDEVHRLFVGMEPVDELLRTSSHYGARVPVGDEADEQTKLIAFTGRHP